MSKVFQIWWCFEKDCIHLKKWVYQHKFLQLISWCRHVFNPQIVRTSLSSVLESQVLERLKTQRRWTFQSFSDNEKKIYVLCPGYPISRLCGCLEAQGLFARPHLGKSPQPLEGTSMTTRWPAPLVFPTEFYFKHCQRSHEGSAGYLVLRGRSKRLKQPLIPRVCILVCFRVRMFLQLCSMQFLF